MFGMIQVRLIMMFLVLRFDITKKMMHNRSQRIR